MKLLAATTAALLLAVAGPAAAQQTQQQSQQTDQQTGQDRIALLIGEGDYRNAPKAETAMRDVDAVADALRDAGWTVTAKTNLDRSAMRQAFESFADDAEDADQIVIYYSGHALRTGGDTYIAPVDTSADSLVDVLFDAVPLELIMRLAENAAGHAVVFIDAAQLDGFKPTGFVEPGLASIEAPDGVLVVSAAPPGQAIRRSEGEESQFAEMIVNKFLDPGAEVMKTAETAGAPIWTAGQTGDDFVLNPPSQTVAQGDLQKEIELAYWRAAERSGKAEDYRTYLARYPNGEFAKFAHDRLDELGASVEAPQPAQVTPAEQAEDQLDLDRADIRKIQQWLRATGHEPGATDGLMGPNTRAAIRDWEQAQGYEVNGYLTKAELDRLSAEGQQALAEQQRRHEQDQRVAEAADNGYWATTGARGTARGYRAYLDKYPQGIHADEARAALDQMAEGQADTQLREERSEWRQARRTDTADAYRAYLAQYPNGIWSGKATARLDELRDTRQHRQDLASAQRDEAALNLGRQDRLSVEQRLRSLGYQPGPLDGNFDNRTRGAVQNFQSNNGLQPTGYLDRQTVVEIVQATSQTQFDISGAQVIQGLLGAFNNAIQSQ